MCETLGLSWTELQDQPQDWVMKSLVIRNQRAKLDQMEMNKNKSKAGSRVR